MAKPVEDAISDGLPDASEPRRIRRDSRGFSPGATFLGRFEIERKLGEGGMGQVFAAFDDRRQARVALKILGELSPNAIRLIKREFRSAAELVHPNLVRLHELFSDGAEWFFTMDLVDGVTLQALVTARPAERMSLIRHVLGQLARALRELHRAGTLHGDLKPSNFLIAEPDQRVVLLDFGLARPLGPTQEREFAGTPAYMAPEQLMGHVLTEAADWYSFGVVLHEALTGELPHRIASAAVLDRAPEDLAQLCLSLLALAPENRPTGDDVIVRLGEPTGERRISVVSPVSRPILFGRQAELAKLEEAFEQSVSGKPSMALLYGASRIGKTALVERFAESLRRRGAHVLTGRCRERESMAYKAADGLIDELVAVLEDMNPADAAALLPEGIPELTMMFPALRLARVVASLPQEDFAKRDQALLRQRAIAAFRELLAELRQRAPLVVWLDDVQWSDEESALLLGRVLGGAEPVPLLFIATYRGEPERATPLLDALRRDRDLILPEPVVLAVGPLGPEDSARLAGEFLPRGSDMAALARTIGQEAAGHPLFIAELAHSATSADEPARLHGASNLPDLVGSRIRALDPVARRLLELSAVAGAPRSRAALRRAEGLTPSHAEAAIDVLKANRLARSSGLREEDTIDTQHDRIREIVVQGLDDARRKQCHLALAHVLESELADKPQVVAAHYEAAGERERAARLWFAGADQALKALAFQHAADLYAKGLELADLDGPARRAMTIRRAEALAHAGKGSEAAELYLQTAPGCTPDEALELRRRAAEQLLLSGHVDRGLVVIEQVLAALGMQKTRTGRRALLALGMSRLFVRARGLRHVPRAESDVPKAQLAQVDASWTIACSLSVIDFMRGADFQGRHLLLALRAGEPKRLLRALTLEVSYAATPGAGSEERTARLLKVADGLVASPDDHHAISLLSLTRGIAAYLQGDTEASLGHCEEALRMLQTHCSGAVWETVTAHRFAIASLFFLGRLRRLSEFVPPLLAEAESTGNLYATMCFRAAYSTAAWLARGDVAEARRQLTRARDQWTARGFQLSHYNVLLGEAFVDFYLGDAERAHARIVEQWHDVRAAGFLYVGVIRAQLWHLRAAGACAAAQAAAARGRWLRARELRSEARGLTRSLRADPLRRAAALADLVDAAVDRLEGDRASARTRLEACAAAFEEQNLGLFAAAARARLGELCGGTLGERELELAREAFAREGVREPDRMLGLFSPWHEQRVGAHP